MVKRWGAVLIVVAMGFGLAAPSTPTVAAATPDPLVADSLKALDALVSSDNCTAKDAADNDTSNDVKLGYQLCDDGVVPSGGGSKGIPVPVAYQPNDSGDDYTGLPAPADDAATAAADAKYDLQPESGNRITLDVDISLPPAGTRRPKGGFPVIVFMHGCCGGNKGSWESPTVDGSNELWHDSNSFFASQGYVVINYTARGFRNSNDQGSTGTTQLDSRRFEINDYQYLVGLLADDDADKKAAGEQPLFGINRRKVAAMGGSYGGGFTWMALTDPTWKSPEHHLGLKLGAAVPKYGWTDLVESLVPSGHYLDQDTKHIGSTVVAPTSVDKALSTHPIGVEKQSSVTGLYAQGSNQSGNHTTFPDYMTSTYQRLQQGEPYDGDPTVEDTVHQFLEDRSAYFQQRFWNRVAKGLRVPIFAAGTFNDPYFPTMETVRFYNKLTSVASNYPIKMYFGDYNHLVAQNKPKEWDSLCGDDHHICTIDDYTHADDSIHLFGKGKGQVRSGALARIDSFLNYYLKSKGRKPANDVSATTTICSSNASKEYPADEPGIEYRAKTWRLLATTVVPFG
ncbi:MAG: hypothetical protein M3290_07530, partial [Actinomycetota bacterium]|nr:hypothetical protein [Actinomycetota bacterium]